MAMFANNALLGGGIRVKVWIENKKDQKKLKDTPKPLMANLDITHALRLALSPGPTQISGKRPGHTCNLSRMHTPHMC